jgi:hypothetical protein
MQCGTKGFVPDNVIEGVWVKMGFGIGLMYVWWMFVGW